MAPMPEPRAIAKTRAEREMERVISGISSSRARTDRSAYINALNPLINTAEGRRFLSKQEGEKALVLIELFDWALNSQGIPLNKGCTLWALRQLCACKETLPESCILPINFKPTEPHHATGGFADVWRGTYKGKEVAFKSIRGSSVSDDAARLKRKRRFCKEVILWKSLNHPNILGLIGVCRWENTPDARLTMVSEWMTNGNIMEYIKHNDAQRMRLLVDCAKGVEYLHSVRLVHGDLKGANVLITSDDPVRACLADFGFMTIVYDEAVGPESTSAFGGGTTPFMAPELLSPTMFGRTKCQVSKEADVYAFAMVILQVLSGLMPFHNLRDTEIAYRAIRGERPEILVNAGEANISDGLRQLLIKCWNPNYTKRPQINEILQHLYQEPTLYSIFPPPDPPQVPSRESIFVSNTQQYADIFVTANMYPQTGESQPFPMPVSPSDTSEYSSSETRNSMSLFSAETQEFSPFTTPGNTQIRVEGPKPPVFETPSWTILNRSDSVIAADDLVASERARKQGRTPSPLPRGPGPLQHDYDKNRHDPTIDDAPHVDLAPVLAQGTLRSPSPRPDPPGGKPTLTKILTTAQLESRNSDSSGTEPSTSGGSGEDANRRPFDSATNIQVVYSESNPHSENAAGLTRRVVEVCKHVDRRKPEYQFPAQLPRSDSKATEDAPKHGLSQITRGRGDSTPSFSSSLSDEFGTDEAPSRRISDANIPTTPGLESGPRPMSELSVGDKGNEIQGGKKTVFPRRKEREDHPRLSDSADYVFVSSKVEENLWDQSTTQRPSSNPSLVKRVLTKLGIRKSPQSSSPQKRAVVQTQKNASVVSMATTTAESQQGRRRTGTGERPSRLSGASLRDACGRFVRHRSILADRSGS